MPTAGDWMTEAPAARRLADPAEIRTRCHELLLTGERGELSHFDLRTDRLPEVARLVVEVTRERYPDLDVPWHSRWRHFRVGGVDRWSRLAAGLDRDERVRVALDLLVVSVLLDAGAGDSWRYREAETGDLLARSEGLAVASLALYSSGAFSADPGNPLRCDAGALRGFTAGQLAAAFQAGPANPLAGVDGRAAMLRALGAALERRPEILGAPPRIGGLGDWLRGGPDRARAASLLATLADAFGSIWPGRITLQGTALGDVWHHRKLRRDDATDRLVPFHKLLQWLLYSMAEPLDEAGIGLGEPGALTGLAEYRNGGLLVDGGVLVPRDHEITAVALDPGAEPVVEWRALTVALLDRLGPLVRATLGCNEAALPLARLLEGGTWAAGRKLAHAVRPGGGPPIRLASDGTVF